MLSVVVLALGMEIVQSGQIWLDLRHTFIFELALSVKVGLEKDFVVQASVFDALELCSTDWRGDFVHYWWRLEVIEQKFVSVHLQNDIYLALQRHPKNSYHGRSWERAFFDIPGGCILLHYSDYSSF